MKAPKQECICVDENLFSQITEMLTNLDRNGQLSLKDTLLLDDVKRVEYQHYLPKNKRVKHKIIQVKSSEALKKLMKINNFKLYFFYHKELFKQTLRKEILIYLSENFNYGQSK